MQIQLINYNGRNENNYSVTECNSFGQAHSLDSYDLNIIDLTSSSIWLNHSSITDFERLDCDNDFGTLSTSIDNSSKTKFLYILPPNIYFKTYYDRRNSMSSKEFLIKSQLKDIITYLVKNLEKVIPIDIDLYYEKTHTNLLGTKLSADFYFDSKMGENYYDGYNLPEDMAYSDGSEKLVFVSHGKYSLTTLQANNNDELLVLIQNVLIDESEEKEPDWFQDLQFFDDSKQSEVIQIENKKIEESKDKIKISKEIIRENKHFESILFKSGPELESILIEMLEKMCDVQNEFEDNKNEDYSFEKDGIHYIFEFKGLTKDVKKSNISQLVTHGHIYEETKEVGADLIKKIIIVNRFKDTKPEERLPVSNNVIEVASNAANNVLIIDSLIFLKMFEQFKTGKLSSEDILSHFREVGLCELDR
ncbi:hypothetical protein [Streptococcus sp. DD04]|uniref:hypothetical protein n=1 Tax=Streptococcus sp. DD04 TaxID=1776578 RepID=UPI0007860F7C|nr:hypothetical protein [Streptococcus sp. DD04]KXT64475.1 hypothetical protein STRDD04_01199 [Streptococcus sp. DD04]